MAAALGVALSLLLDEPGVLSWVLGTALALLAVGAAVTGFFRSGRTTACTLLGLRTVDRRTALPQPLRNLSREHWLTADTRLGRDPLRIEATEEVRGKPDGGHWWPGPEFRRGSARLVLDDGAAFQISAPTVVGRDPVAPMGVEAQSWTVPDLSRTVSKTHALLEPAPGGVRITDLESSRGTAVAPPGMPFSRLTPGLAITVPFGYEVALGERFMEVRVASGQEV